MKLSTDEELGNKNQDGDDSDDDSYNKNDSYGFDGGEWQLLIRNNSNPTL